MRRQTPRAASEPKWFLSDRPIKSEQEDRLGSMSLAKTLVDAIASAEPPCMIGLLGGFGSGKSSVTRLAASMLDGSVFDSVTTSADKHSGNARARNLVHAIAGELEGDLRIDSGEVNEILRPLRQSTQVTAVDPTDTGWGRFGSGRYSFKTWLKSMRIPLFVAAVLVGVALLAGGVVKSGSLAAAAIVVLGWFVRQQLSNWADAVKGLGAGASLTDHKPRAEAADEIEVVFGQLVDLHKKKRKGRRLVVFVDDIDRLSKDDLLDALRSLRSLQSVPRGAEPVFVISCDEAILRSAVRGSLSHPATVTERDAAAGGTEQVSDHADDSGPPVEGRRVSGSEHDHPALAFVDKLLTARVQVPPAMGGDMRRFALTAIGDDHPLRAEVGIDVDRIVSILIHDGVGNPRSAIRLLNRFMAAYLLAKDREDNQQVAIGDITDHMDVLAQLCVLLDEYPQFYEEIASNTVLLSAARKVALRDRNLTPSEADALRSSGEFCPSADGGDSPFEFVRPSLRRFLSGSARRVTLPLDVGPLVYYMATPGGRILGAQVRLEIVSGVQSGDHADLAQTLDRVPADQISAVAGEIEQMLHDASSVDASTYISAVAPNLYGLEDGASSVGDACADLLDQSPDEGIPAPVLTPIITHTGPERHDLLCERLVRPDADTGSMNSRMVHVAEYLADNPQIRSLVEPAVTRWVESLPGEGGWGMARTWLGAAEALDPDSFEDLCRQIAVSLVRSVRAEKGFSRDDADRLVRLVTAAAPGVAAAAPNAEDLSGGGPITRSAFVRLWQVTGHDGGVDDAMLAAEAAADVDTEPDVRRSAIRQTAAWADEWVDAEWDSEEEAQSGEVCDVIVGHLAEATSDPGVLVAVSDALPGLAVALGPHAEPLVSAVTEAARELAGEHAGADRAAKALIEVVDAVEGTEHENSFDQHPRRIFETINSDNDPSDPVAQLAVRLIPVAAQSEASRTILGSQVRRWGQSLVAAGDADHRNRIAGMRAVFEVEPSLIEDEANAESILDQTRQLIHGGDHVAERLQTLARFPWPDDLVEPALSAIDEHWEQAPEDVRGDALELVVKASDDFDDLRQFHSRIANAVQSDPRGATSKIAAAEVKRMRADAARVVFASAVGKHDAVTAAWNTLDADAAARHIVHQTHDADTVTCLLGALPPDSQAPAAAAAMGLAARTAAIPEAAVRAVAACCDPSVLTHVAQTAIEHLSDNGPVTASALQAIIVARDNQATVNIDPVQRQATELLPETTPQIAGLFGRLLKGKRQTAALKTRLKDLRNDNSDRKAIATAFDAAYEA